MLHEVVLVLHEIPRGTSPWETRIAVMFFRPCATSADLINVKAFSVPVVPSYPIGSLNSENGTHLSSRSTRSMIRVRMNRALHISFGRVWENFHLSARYEYMLMPLRP